MIDFVFTSCRQHSVLCMLLGTKNPFLLNCYRNFLVRMLHPPIRPIILTLSFKVIPSVNVKGQDAAIFLLFLKN